MTRQEVLELTLDSFRRYYDINRETPAPPFAAEAVFSVHDEGYFLIKAAKVAEIESQEHVFFAEAEELTPELAENLENAAWEEGLRRTNPCPNHRNTDITLVLITDHMAEDAEEKIRRAHRYKSYRFGLRGWNELKMIAYDLSTGRIAANRQARSLEKVMANIKNHYEKESST